MNATLSINTFAKEVVPMTSYCFARYNVDVSFIKDLLIIFYQIPKSYRTNKVLLLLYIVYYLILYEGYIRYHCIIIQYKQFLLKFWGLIFDFYHSKNTNKKLKLNYNKLN